MVWTGSFEFILLSIDGPAGKQGHTLGMFFSSCLYVLYTDYCGVSNHPFFSQNCSLFFISCPSKTNISPRTQFVPFLEENVKISFSFLLSGSHLYVIPVLLPFIAHIECPVVGRQFAYVLVCGQLLTTNLTYLSVGKNTAKGNEKELLCLPRVIFILLS